MKVFCVQLVPNSIQPPSRPCGATGGIFLALFLETKVQPSLAFKPLRSRAHCSNLVVFCMTRFIHSTAKDKCISSACQIAEIFSWTTPSTPRIVNGGGDPARPHSRHPGRLHHPSHLPLLIPLEPGPSFVVTAPSVPSANMLAQLTLLQPSQYSFGLDQGESKSKSSNGTAENPIVL